MTDSIIDQAAQVIYRHHVMVIDGGTASSSRAECSCGHTSVALGGARDFVAKRHDRHITEALAKAGLLRPEIDADMIERASKVLWEHPDFPGTWQELSSSARMTYRILARTGLEVALGGEQA